MGESPRCVTCGGPMYGPPPPASGAEAAAWAVVHRVDGRVHFTSSSRVNAERDMAGYHHPEDYRVVPLYALPLPLPAPAAAVDANDDVLPFIPGDDEDAPAAAEQARVTAEDEQRAAGARGLRRVEWPPPSPEEARVPERLRRIETALMILRKYRRIENGSTAHREVVEALEGAHFDAFRAAAPGPNAARGEVVEHVCGLQGYQRGNETDPPCPACKAGDA